MKSPEQIAEEIANPNWRYGGLVPLRDAIAAAIRRERERAEKAEYQLHCFEEHDGPSCLLREKVRKSERDLLEAIRLLKLIDIYKAPLLAEFWERPGVVALCAKPPNQQTP